MIILTSDDYIESWVHRNTEFSQYIGESFRINGIDMFVAKLYTDLNWWIIPEYENDELHVLDIGPFNTSDEALVFAKLSDGYDDF